MSSHPDVLIIGGGVIGLTTAYFLAKEGRRVEVLDKSDFGQEASWAGAGIIPPGNPERAASAHDRLRADSSRLFPGFSSELREDFLALFNREVNLPLSKIHHSTFRAAACRGLSVKLIKAHGAATTLALST